MERRGTFLTPALSACVLLLCLYATPLPPRSPCYCVTAANSLVCVCLQLGVFTLSTITQSCAEQLTPHLATLLNLFGMLLGTSSPAIHYYVILSMTNLTPYLGSDQLVRRRTALSVLPDAPYLTNLTPYLTNVTPYLGGDQPVRKRPTVMGCVHLRFDAP